MNLILILNFFFFHNLQSEGEKKVKKKKAKESAADSPADSAAETPASGASAAESRGSTRGSSSRRAKKAPSSVFVLFSQKQIAEFKEVSLKSHEVSSVNNF